MSEAVAVGRALEALERPKAKERERVRKGKQPGAKSENFSDLEKGRTLDKVGSAVGVSRITYQRAAAIVEAAEDDPATFAALVVEMDEKGKVNGTFQKMKRLKAEAHRAKMAAGIRGGRAQVRVGDFREVLPAMHKLVQDTVAALRAEITDARVTRRANEAAGNGGRL